jgi:hypothetical protein
MENDITPEPIQSLWIGKQLSKVEQLCIQSFLDHEHPFHLYTYGKIDNVPAGAQVFDAGTIIGEDKIFRFENGWGKGSVSGFADLFRLLMLQKNGGWWVDMDIVCIKPFTFKQDTVICSSNEGEYGSLANNCVIKAPKNSALIKYCLDELAKTDLKKMTFGSAGPFLFQKAVKDLQIEDQIVAYQCFNPISWRFIGELVLGNMSAASKFKELVRPVFKPQTMPGRRITSATHAVHFWNEVWNAAGYDKNGTYSSHSLFEKLKRKHGIK